MNHDHRPLSIKAREWAEAVNLPPEDLADMFKREASREAKLLAGICETAAPVDPSQDRLERISLLLLLAEAFEAEWASTHEEVGGGGEREATSTAAATYGDPSADGEQ